MAGGGAVVVELVGAGGAVVVVGAVVLGAEDAVVCVADTAVGVVLVLWQAHRVDTAASVRAAVIVRRMRFP